MIHFRTEEFAKQATAAFTFLLNEQFVGPNIDTYRVAFVSSGCTVEILLDDLDGRVETIIDASVGSRNPRASLECLYVEAQLGPAQHIRDIARTTSTLESALRSQAAALRRLLPIMAREDFPELLLECHGR